MEPNSYDWFTAFQFSGWRVDDGGAHDGEEQRRILTEMLKGHEDLLERTKEILPLFAEEKECASDAADTGGEACEDGTD